MMNICTGSVSLFQVNNCYWISKDVFSSHAESIFTFRSLYARKSRKYFFHSQGTLVIFTPIPAGLPQCQLLSPQKIRGFRGIPVIPISVQSTYDSGDDLRPLLCPVHSAASPGIN